VTGATGTTGERSGAAAGSERLPPPVVAKFGGELLEDPAHLAAVTAAVARVARTESSLVIVHGGGREIDAALAQVGIPRWTGCGSPTPRRSTSWSRCWRAR
jgi:acetylglutamate kinase